MNKGSCSVTGTVDGHQSTIKFQDMEVEMPILSVRKMVKNKHRVQFHENGGYIENIATGHKMLFHQHAGVYYLKLKVDDISLLEEMPSGKGNESGFARPGR